MKKSPLYTRTGDTGTTSLIGGQRTPKNSPRVEAYGTVDELNALIGLLQSHLSTLLHKQPDTSAEQPSSELPTQAEQPTTEQVSNLAKQPTPIQPEDSALTDAARTLADETTQTLLGISNTLFNIGAALATPDGSDLPTADTDRIRLPQAIDRLENRIDRLDSQVPPLRSFILPGGNPTAALAHVARTVCRRAERTILTAIDAGATISPDILTYINRLSDYLFILARHINHTTSTPELPWQPS